MNTNDQTAELEQLAMHRVKITEEIKHLEDLRRTYDEQIAELAGDGTHQAGPYKVTVTRPRRLDAKKIEAAFPVAKHPEFYKRAVDTAAFKKAIAENDRAGFETIGAPTIRVSS